MENFLYDSQPSKNQHHMMTHTIETWTCYECGKHFEWKTPIARMGAPTDRRVLKAKRLHQKVCKGGRPVNVSEQIKIKNDFKKRISGQIARAENVSSSFWNS